MGLFWAKYARRIFAIVSTTSIPDLAPVSPTEATVDPPSRGSRLDADHPENGVLIPRRFTARRGTASSAPGIPQIVCQKNNETITSTGFKVKRLASSAAFAAFTRLFLAQVVDPASVPAREGPNLLAKYRVTTGAVALSRR